MQTDEVRDIPCGTRGGVLITFDKVICPKPKQGAWHREFHLIHCTRAPAIMNSAPRADPKTDRGGERPQEGPGRRHRPKVLSPPPCSGGPCTRTIPPHGSRAAALRTPACGCRNRAGAAEPRVPRAGAGCGPAARAAVRLLESEAGSGSTTTRSGSSTRSTTRSTSSAPSTRSRRARPVIITIWL